MDYNFTSTLVFSVFITLSGGYLMYFTLWRPFWYRSFRVKERIARKVARQVGLTLNRAFGIGNMWVDEYMVRTTTTLKFIHPLWEGVTLIDPSFPESGTFEDVTYIAPVVKIWGGWRLGLIEHEVWRVNLEVDLNRLPYHTSLTDILNQAKEIEEHLSLVMGTRVLLPYRSTNKAGNQDGKKRHRLTIKVIFRERKKAPALFYYDVETTQQEIQAFFNFKATQNREQEKRYKQFMLKLLLTSMREFDGEFPIKKMQERFNREASHRTIETIARDLEYQNILLPAEGTRPRKISPKAETIINQYIKGERSKTVE